MIESDNIYIRALEKIDAPTIYNFENDPDVWSFGTTFEPLSLDSITKYIERAQKYDIYVMHQLRLMICRKTDNLSVGCVDITDFDPHNSRATLGVMIMKSQRNKGYADEALKLTLTYIFKYLHVNTLYCEIETTNIPSLNLFKKNGFEVKGIKEQWVKIDNEYRDVAFLQKMNNRTKNSDNEGQNR